MTTLLDTTFTFMRRLGWLAVSIIVIDLILVLFAQHLTPYNPTAQDLMAANQEFSAAHWLGTDHLGRDTLSRLIAGSQTTLVAVVVVVLFSMSIGLIIGTISGYVGGWFDEIVMRIIDFMLSIPSLIVALAMIGIFGLGYWNMVAALTIAWIPSYARISRGVVVATVHQPHIESLWVLGASRTRLIVFHLLPTATRSILVYASVDAGVLALAIATLSFLGLGIQPPMSEWGEMFVDAMPYLDFSPRQIILPGLALTLTVAGFNYLGERLAALDAPRAISGRALRVRLANARKLIVS
jgi:ABC-type dipeptide/oligopeptide/nickel transport system permease subunit